MGVSCNQYVSGVGCASLCNDRVLSLTAQCGSAPPACRRCPPRVQVQVVSQKARVLVHRTQRLLTRSLQLPWCAVEQSGHFPHNERPRNTDTLWTYISAALGDEAIGLSSIRVRWYSCLSTASCSKSLKAASLSVKARCANRYRTKCNSMPSCSTILCADCASHSHASASGPREMQQRN